ncbi:RING finger protein [Ceratobasidium sp. AG-Ba]|nr:RING finger protein [Ceratobasidium sp. AG-Ba]
MGSALSAVRTGRISLKRRGHADGEHDENSSSRHPKRLREHLRSSSPPVDSPDGRLRDGSSPPPASGDTTLVDDFADEHEASSGTLKGKARDDMCSSSVVSVLIPVQDATEPPSSPPDQRALQLADEIESELRCGCCTEIAYNSLPPFLLWLLYDSSSFALPLGSELHSCHLPGMPVVQSLVSALIRVYPERARTERERAQADEIYTAGRDIQIPPPRTPNPDVLLPQQQNSAADNLARPCPHCAPNNSFDWTCPRPIPNPETDAANAWNLDNGSPPGHSYCGACDELYAIGAPTSSRCDMCTTGFCGISVPRVCRSQWLHQVQLLSTHSSLQGLIEDGKVYEAFNGNAIEVEIMFDYLREAEISPHMIYLDIVDHTLAGPGGFEPLINSGLFAESHQPEMRVSDAQYTSERSSLGSNTRVSEPPSILFADFTDDEDSDGEGDVESESSRRRTAGGRSEESVTRPVETMGGTRIGETASAGAERTDETGNGMVLPRFADFMRTMRDVDVLPSFTFVEPQTQAQARPAPSTPHRRRICRECATALFTHGLKDWWAREMRTTLGMERLPVWVTQRKMCGNGEACSEQGNYDHSKAYCHIAQPPTGGPSTAITTS